MNKPIQRQELLQKWFKEDPNFSYEKLEAVSDVPKSTAQRIILKGGDSAQFDSVCKIVVALGHTVDEYLGIVKDDKELTMVSLMKSTMEQQLRERDIILELRLAEKDAIIDAKKRSVDYLRKLVLILGSTVAVFFLICMVISFVLLYHTAPGM